MRYSCAGLIDMTIVENAFWDLVSNSAIASSFAVALSCSVPCVMFHKSFARSKCFIWNFHVDQFSPLSLSIDQVFSAFL